MTVKPNDRAAAVARLAGSLAHYGKGPGSAVRDDEAIMRMVGEDDVRIRAYGKDKGRKRS